MKRRELFETAYVVLRLDQFQLRDGVPDDPRVYLTAKEVVWAEDEAKSEVDRLNRLNADKDCHYWWQGVRVERRDIAKPS